MYPTRILVLLFVTTLIQSDLFVCDDSIVNKTAAVLWNLTRYAIQSRQNDERFLQNHHINTINLPTNYQHQYLKSQYNQGVSNSYPRPQIVANINHNGLQYPDPYLGMYVEQYLPTYQLPNLHHHAQHYPQSQVNFPPHNQIFLGHPPFQHRPPSRPNIDYPQTAASFISSLIPKPETFMEALNSIARNDDLNCVPRLLCEITSGSLSGRQGLSLPLNINMESIVGLLSAVRGVDSNPLLSFGKASLLGYSSKGNAESCMYAYPNCPKDSDHLVDYLNNHNGGFFRFFKGINPQRPNPLTQHNFPQGSSHQNIANYGPFYHHNKVYAQKRIQTRPSVEFQANGIDSYGNRLKFPDYIEEQTNELSPIYFPHSYQQGSLTFPSRDNDDFDLRNRKQQQLSFHFNSELDFQRPLPNHKATPMIFPDRTGTGNLRLDPEELNGIYRGPFALQNNNIISFIPDQNNDAFYYTNSNKDNSRVNTDEFNKQNKLLFTFPP